MFDGCKLLLDLLAPVCGHEPVVEVVFQHIADLSGRSVQNVIFAALRNCAQGRRWPSKKRGIRRRFIEGVISLMEAYRHTYMSLDLPPTKPGAYDYTTLAVLGAV